MVKVTRTAPPQTPETASVPAMRSVPTPTADVVSSGVREETTVDDLGREIVVREMTKLEQFRFVKAFGGENEDFKGICAMISVVRRIGEKVYGAIPMNAQQVEMRFEYLGDVGMKAVTELAMRWQDEPPALDEAHAKK